MKHPTPWLLAFAVLAAACGDDGLGEVAPDGGDPVEAPDAGSPDAEPRPEQLTAIVALGGCSASIVRFTTSRPDDAALVLTNGHCIGGDQFLGPGEAIANRPSSRTMGVLEPDALTPGPPTEFPEDVEYRVIVNATELVYATMTDTDLALYRLGITYSELEVEHGVYAMPIADQQADVGTAIEIPSGLWAAIYACSIEDVVHELREDQWTWHDSMRYHQPGCEVVGGTSGSPVVATDTGMVIGVNNTGNEDGEACTFGNPCEVEEDGEVVVLPGAGYGQQVHRVYGCLDDENQLDFDRPDCRLTRP